jgi:hypothetical protein
MVKRRFFAGFVAVLLAFLLPGGRCMADVSAQLAQAKAYADERQFEQAEAVYHGISAEVVRGDFAKALSYAKELGNKYPKGRYGKGASRLCETIVELEKDG